MRQGGSEVNVEGRQRPHEDKTPGLRAMGNHGRILSSKRTQLDLLFRKINLLAVLGVLDQRETMLMKGESEVWSQARWWQCP